MTKTELVFVPHAFNITSDYRLVFPYVEIKDLSKREEWMGLSRQIVVTAKDGNHYAFVMWGRDALLNCVQKQL